MRNILIMLALAATFIIQSSFGAHARGLATGVDTDSLPSYVRIVTDNEEPEVMPDSIFYAVSGKVIFVVNKTNLNLNSDLIKELKREVFPYINENNLMLVGIDLRGAASPEGPYQNNVRLSVGRAAALRHFLEQNLDSVQIDNVRTNTVAEDYVYLLRMMEQAGDPETYIVRAIIDRCGIGNMHEIKRQLRAYKGGRLWRRLLDTYYPDLRAARVVLYFRNIYEPREIVTICTVDPRTEIEIPQWQPEPEIAGVNLSPFRMERPHLLALSSNLLYDAFYMPNFGWAPMLNIAAEYFPRHGKFTFRAGFTSPYYHRWNKHKFFQIRDYHLEVRRYFNPGKLHTGWYGAVYANAAKYGIGFNARKGWQGEGYGAAIKMGYVLPLGGGRMRLDFHAAAGGFTTRYDPYIYGNPITGENDGDYYYDWTLGPETFNRRNYRFNWLGPTEIGITLTFDVLYHRIFSGEATARRYLTF